MIDDLGSMQNVLVSAASISSQKAKVLAGNVKNICLTPWSNAAMSNSTD